MKARRPGHDHTGRRRRNGGGSKWMLAWLIGFAGTLAQAAPPLPRDTSALADDPRWLQSLPQPVTPLPRLQSPPPRVRTVTPPTDTTTAAIQTPSTPATPTEQTGHRPAPDRPGEPEAPPGPAEAEALMIEEPEPPTAMMTEPTAVAHDAPAEDASTAEAHRWQVQLLAGRSLNKVEQDRDDLLRLHGRLLEGVTLTISQSRFGDERDAYYRLRALEWTHEQEAMQWCARLRAAGARCYVTRVTRAGD